MRGDRRQLLSKRLPSVVAIWLLGWLLATPGMVTHGFHLGGHPHAVSGVPGRLSWLPSSRPSVHGPKSTALSSGTKPTRQAESLAAEKDHDHQAQPFDRATFLVSAVNLLKNCVGSGVFSLGSRVSKVAVTTDQYLAVGVLICVLASWGAYNFYLIGETCRLTVSHTYRDAWSRAVSDRSSSLVQLVIILAPIVGCIANTIVLTDVLKLVLFLGNAPAWLVDNRVALVTILTSCILYPLCLVDNLAALRSVSIAGLVGQLAAMAVFAIRLMDGSYRPGGAYYDDFQSTIARRALSSIPVLSTPSSAASMAATDISVATAYGNLSSWFVLASLVSYCLVAHYNAPRYFSELAHKERDRFRFLKMTSIAYALTAIFYGASICLSTMLFGENTMSFSLNNFSRRDPLAAMAFVAFGTSVLASFPLVFFNTRNFFLRQTESIPMLTPMATVRRVSIGLLLGIGWVASQCTDMGNVGSLSGAMLGSLIMFVFPPIMYLSARFREMELSGQAVSKLVVGMNVVLLLGGLTLGGIGTYNSLLALWRG